MSEELSATLWAGIPGTIALVLTKYLTGWARDMLLFLGVVLALFAVVIFLFWMRDQWIEGNRRIAESKDRIYQLAEQARFLSPEQIAFVQAAAHIGTDLTVEGEQYLRGTDAPLWFVGEFLGRSYNRCACPVRTWNDGSDKRTWANQITSVLVGAGFATMARGNESALWAPGVSPESIAKKLGITLKAAPPCSRGMAPNPRKWRVNLPLTGKNDASKVVLSQNLPSDIPLEVY
jgi:hypothetical protein